MPPTSRTFRAPRGTRDAYPEDALKRRYITQAWRDASIRHGFDEIEGPTFEHLELYTQKSGDEIVSQLFSFRREGGDDVYALRPEFTPTLARMYAAKANSLPKPIKWFTAGPYFRAEKTQRGRLREFLQWNCDIMGGCRDVEDRLALDAEMIGCCLELTRDLGLRSSDVTALLSDRRIMAARAKDAGISADRYQSLMWARDNQGKLTPAQGQAEFEKRGITSEDVRLYLEYEKKCNEAHAKRLSDREKVESIGVPFDLIDQSVKLQYELDDACLEGWHQFEAGIVRGLAYYTGMVFEVIAEGERDVCGGGRYDNLIELFGGPPTPAVGFGMGDVVLSLLLEDKGLMPQGKDLLEAVSRRQASARPDAFVITADEQFDPIVKRTVATLRAGRESEAWLERDDRKPWDADRYSTAPLHARRSYKATRNIGKLLKDATSQHARNAVIIESDEVCNVKNLDTGEQRENITLTDLPAHLA